MAAALLGCGEPAGDYVAASAIAKGGIVRDREASPLAEGRTIRLWGYVDHANLYGDDGARTILADGWSGPGPDPTRWRFNLKAKAQDAPGHSFAVRVPNDEGRDEILRVFVADAREHRPTRVFLTGRLFTFAAPTNAVSLTGLYMELESSQAIRFRPPAQR